MRQRSDNVTLYSNIINRNIDLEPSIGRKAFTISGGDAYKIAKSKGFEFSIITPVLDLFSAIYCTMYAYNDLDVVAGTSLGAGSKCDFILFGGKQLKEGWTFNSYDWYANCSPPKRNYSVDQQPTLGSRDIKFKIHAWADPPDNSCWFSINSITLEGPENARWQDAF
jgi:hypothetical protein